MRTLLRCLLLLAAAGFPALAQRYTSADGKLRGPSWPSNRSRRMDGLLGPSRAGQAGGTLAVQGAHVRVEAGLTAEEDKEYGGWKRLVMR